MFRVLNNLTKKHAALFTHKSMRSFCAYEAYLSPKLHITTTHNFNNVYEDVVMIGDYMVPYNDQSKIESQKYFPSIVQLTFDYLNKKYVRDFTFILFQLLNITQPELKLNPETYEEIRIFDWKKYGVNFDEAKFDILDILSKELFITENKFRYPIEQRLRLQATTRLLSYFNLNNYRIEFFFDMYNSWIRLNVARSHLFQSPHIKGDLSFLEKYAIDNDTTPIGIPDLSREIVENNTFVNKLMRFIHA